MAPLPPISLYNVVSKWIISKDDGLDLNIPEFEFLKSLPELEPKALKRLTDSLETDLVEINVCCTRFKIEQLFFCFVFIAKQYFLSFLFDFFFIL